MFCWKCGAENPETSPFCLQCGAKLAVSKTNWRDNRRNRLVLAIVAVAILISAAVIVGWVRRWPFAAPESPIPSNVYIEYVLDASNSMMQDLTGGRTKLEVARSALTEHWQGLDGQPHLGLRALGHRYHAADAESCLDTELLAPAAQRQIKGLIRLVNGVTAQGMSPLSVALREIAGDFSLASGRTNALVLIADGGDNCDGNPCQMIQFQREVGIRYPIYVVGLGVDPASREQLVCLAETSGGLYRDALTESELLMALDEFVSEIMASER